MKKILQCTLLVSCVVFLFACVGENDNPSVGNGDVLAPTAKFNLLDDDTVHVSTGDDCYIDPNESAIDQCYLYEYAYAANGNKIAMFKVGANGQLQGLGTVTSGLPDSASISSITVSPNTHNVYATVKNGSNDDQIFMLSIGIGDGMLTPLATPLISTHQTGISSIVVSNDSRYAYVTDASQICSYEIDEESGGLNNKVCQTPKIGNQTYAPYYQVLLSSSNQYAYVMGGSNHNVLLMFKRESNTRELSLIESRGMINNTRDMYIPDSRKYLYTARTDNKSVGQYGINPDTGVVKPLSPETVNSGMEPHTVASTRSGKYVYAANYYSNSISMYSAESQTGKLSILSLESIATLTNPDKIMVDPTGSWSYVSTTHGEIAQYSINRDTGVLTPLSPSSVPVSPTVGELTFARIVRRHVFPLVPDNDDRFGLLESATITIGCDATVDCSALNVTMSETESHIGEIDVEPDSDTVNASSIDYGTMVPVDFDIVYKSAQEFKLDPVNLDEGRVVFLTIDGSDVFGNTIHQIIQYTSKSTTPIVVSPPDLNYVVPSATFIIQYPDPISELIVNDSTLYLTKEGSTEHVPAHIIIKAAGSDDGNSGGCRLFSFCGDDPGGSAELVPSEDLDEDADHVLTVGVTKTKVKGAKKETSGLVIYAAYSNNYRYAQGDMNKGYKGNLTDSIYSPNNAGNPVAAADYICSIDRNKPGTTLVHPSGNATFKAIISLRNTPGHAYAERYACGRPGMVWGTYCGGEDSCDWVLSSGAKYITKSQHRIAYASSSATLPRILTSPIIGSGEDRTFTGDALPPRNNDVWQRAWTGTSFNWTPSAANCNGWTTSSDNKRFMGSHGLPDSYLRAQYLSNETLACNTYSAIYCAEQP